MLRLRGTAKVRAGITKNDGQMIDIIFRSCYYTGVADFITLPAVICFSDGHAERAK